MQQFLADGALGCQWALGMTHILGQCRTAIYSSCTYTTVAVPWWIGVQTKPNGTFDGCPQRCSGGEVKLKINLDRDRDLVDRYCNTDFNFVAHRRPRCAGRLSDRNYPTVSDYHNCINSADLAGR